MTDPFAPVSSAAARFPGHRLARAGLDEGAVEKLRAKFDKADDDARVRFSHTVASVSDSDLADGDALDAAFKTPAGRKPTRQEQAQADQPMFKEGAGKRFDPTTATLAEVEDYLDDIVDVGEARRVADAEAKRTDRDPRKGVASAVDDAVTRLSTGKR